MHGHHYDFTEPPKQVISFYRPSRPGSTIPIKILIFTLVNTIFQPTWSNTRSHARGTFELRGVCYPNANYFTDGRQRISREKK